MDTFALTQSGGAPEEPLPITSQEEKELKRVFDMLSNYSQQIHLIREIDDLYALIPGAKIQADKFIGSGHLVDLDRVDQMNAQTQRRIDELTQDLNELAARPDKKISIADVKEMLKQLGQRANRQEVEEMVWEVDEDLDQCISWKEFKLMFTRNIKDKSGLEPSRMVCCCLVTICFLAPTLFPLIPPTLLLTLFFRSTTWCSSLYMITTKMAWCQLTRP